MLKGHQLNAHHLSQAQGLYEIERSRAAGMLSVPISHEIDHDAMCPCEADLCQELVSVETCSTNPSCLYTRKAV